MGATTMNQQQLNNQTAVSATVPNSSRGHWGGGGCEERPEIDTRVGYYFSSCRLF